MIPHSFKKEIIELWWTTIEKEKKRKGKKK